MNFTRLKKQLTLHEDRRATPYVDTVGQITAGIGHNLSAHPIASDIIDRWYDEDVAEAERTCRTLYPNFDGLGDVRQRVLMDMAFNLGLTKLRKFYGANAAIRRGDFDLAASHMLDSLWARQVGRRATRLAAMMRSGVDSIDF